MEQWKSIYGYDGYYEVSNTGKVKSLSRQIIRSNGRVQTFKERILRPSITKDGYLRVILTDTDKLKHHLISRLVCEAFCEKPIGAKQNLQVNHKDGLKDNNEANNLEWVTGSENTLHAYDNELFHGTIKVKEEDIKIIKALLAEGKKPKEIISTSKMQPHVVRSLLYGGRYKRLLVKMGLAIENRLIVDLKYG